MVSGVPIHSGSVYSPFHSSNELSAVHSVNPVVNWPFITYTAVITIG